MKTLVWTDGSCNAEGVAGRGGWAALIERDGSTEQLVGSAMETTQNRMELTAVCEALQRADGAIEVRTDSTYIEKCFREGWHIRWRQDDKWRTTKGPVKNKDLWGRLFALVEDDARDVRSSGVREALKRTTRSSIASPERLRNRTLRTEPPLNSSHQWALKAQASLGCASVRECRLNTLLAGRTR
jgi:ribonuclease HI